MKVLVTFALESEFTPWRRGRGFQSATRNDVPVHVGRFRGADVDVLVTGIGRQNARQRVSRVLQGGSYDLVVSSGLAGALNPALLPGTIVAARSVTLGAPELPAYSDREALRIAESRGARAVPSFFTADHVVLHASEKSRLSTQADAVEMESYDVLEAATQARVRAVAIRAVSDAAGETLPLDFNRALTPSGEVSVSRMMLQVARRPMALAALVRFGRRSERAAERLGEFLAGYVNALGASNGSSIAPPEMVAR